MTSPLFLKFIYELAFLFQYITHRFYLGQVSILLVAFFFFFWLSPQTSNWSKGGKLLKKISECCRVAVCIGHLEREMEMTNIKNILSFERTPSGNNFYILLNLSSWHFPAGSLQPNFFCNEKILV